MIIAAKLMGFVHIYLVPAEIQGTVLLTQQNQRVFGGAGITSACFSPFSFKA